MSATFFDLMKYASTGIASPSMTAYDKMRALAAFGGGKTRTLTGVPPLSFKANGKPLISWSMLGNGQQSGTPTPDAPIMPDFCGVRTGNLFDRAGESEGKYISSSGTMTDGYQWYASDYIPVESSTTYTFNPNSQRGTSGKHAFYSTDKSFISYVDSGPQTFTTPANAAFIRFSYRTASYDIMLNTGSTALPYEPYGYKIPVTNAGTTTNIYALEPLRKIGDYADVVGSMGTVTRKIYKWILTGQETGWTMATASGITVARRALPYAPKISDGKAVPIVCTHYVGQLSNDSGKAYISNNGQWIQFSDSTNATDEATWTAYLSAKYSAGTPVTVWYVLATPTTEQTTAPTIPTQNGANTISVDSTIPPSSLTIQYTSPDINERDGAHQVIMNQKGVNTNGSRYTRISDEF